MRRKAPRSSEFPTTGPSTQYLLSGIPRDLWKTVKAKAKREGVSLRTLVLRLLSKWVAGDQPVDGAQP